MGFPPHFLEDLRNRLSLPEEVAKKVRLTRRGHEYTGLCPFHKEKTPSFTVSGDKGFYHCFGCGAHGDIVSFVMANEGLSFPEAVEKLALEAGMPIPKSTPEEREKEQKRASLYEVMEIATSFYEKNLQSAEGRKALLYLKERGLNDNAIYNFRLGFSGTGSLRAELKKHHIDDAQMIATGLFASSYTAGKEPYEYFRNRIMFPISDKRGRVIAFGGRVMDDSEPKYLNSPETELFHKGDILYALSKAAPSARSTGDILLVEGYMDVISLHEAGFTNAVAPLGTAFTERQIEELWRIVPEPTICFDGDSAGKRAGLRALDRALPILKAGYSLKFNFLPENLDPDEYIKKYGKQAFSSFLEDSIPLSSLLWQHLIEGKSLNTPERRAKLEKDIEDSLSRIKDETVRTYYHRELKQKVWDLFSSYNKKKFKQTPPLSIGSTGKLPECKAGRDESRMLAAYLVLYPEYMAKWLESLMRIEFSDKETEMIASFASDEIMTNPDISKETLTDAFEQAGLKDKLSSIAKEIEMLSAKKRFPEDINKDMRERIMNLELTALTAEIEEVSTELSSCLDNPPAELWNRYQSLLKEKNKILLEIY